MTIDRARSSETTLEGKIVSDLPILPPKAITLFKALEATIRRAIADGVLRTKQHEVLHLLKLKRDTEDGTPLVLIEGGIVEHGRESDEFFYRVDGARISFGMIMIESREGLELHSYRFSIWFGLDRSPRFIRIDLNPQRIHDALSAPRSHMHPGSDEILMAYPVVAPEAILLKLLYGTPLP